jgi:hypothetical protein
MKPVTKGTVKSALFFMRTCVPRVPNMINYIFSTQMQISNGTVPAARNKVLYEWLS